MPGDRPADQTAGRCERRKRRIAPCTLSAFNLVRLRAWTSWKSWRCWLFVPSTPCWITGLPNPAAKRGAMGRRTLGIGVINFAYWLAKNGKRYSDGSANNLTHQTFEAIQYLPDESL
ncbi:hypothetical protein ACVXG7_23740 [Enterobacter hormaechei]